MRILLVSFLFIVTSCAGDSDPAPIDANSATLDAASCKLSIGCDFVVTEQSECPDSINNPSICSGLCGGFECCWCEGTEARTLNIDCADGCIDAGR